MAELDDEGRSPLFWALQPVMIFSVGNFDVLRTLIRLGVDLSQCYDDKNPLMTTCDIDAFGGDTGMRVMEFLLDNGADVNQQANDGNTALMIEAANKKYKKLMKNLLKSGADISMVNKRNKSVMSVAYENLDSRENGDIRCIEIWLEHGEDCSEFSQNLFFKAAFLSSPKCMEYIIQTGLMDVKSLLFVDDDTALTYAARFASYDCLKVILDQGGVNVMAKMIKV
jgi:ankyrin repeat protein